MTQKQVRKYLCLIMAGVFVVTSLIILILPNHLIADAVIFRRWGEKMLDQGIMDFYSTSNTDYPPLMLLLLYGIAFITQGFTWVKGILFVYCLVPIIATTLGVLVFYALAREFGIDQRKSIILSAFYGFAPALMFVIAIGQFDTMIACFIMLTLLLFMRGKYYSVFAISAVAVLFKLHFAYFVFPLLFIAVAFKMYEEKRLLKFGLFVGGVILAGLCVYIPFVIKEGDPLFLYHVVSDPLLKRNRFSEGAFNALFLFNIFGLKREVMYPEWFGYINLLVFIAVNVLTMYLYIRKRTNWNLALMIMFNFVALFMLTASMRARYVTPVLCLILILAYACKDKRLRNVAWASYIMIFLGQAFLMMKYTEDCTRVVQQTFNAIYLYLGFVQSIINIIIFVFLTIAVLRVCDKPSKKD